MSISQEDFVPVVTAFSTAERLQEDATRSILNRFSHAYPTLEALRVDRAALKVQWDAANERLRRTGRRHTVSFSLFFDRAIRVMCKSTCVT